MREPDASCDLCRELGGNPQDGEFARTYGGDPAQRSITGTENFRVIADLSPLVEGHALLLPVQHYLNFASVLADHRAELEELLNRVLTAYRNIYEVVTVFEHGSSKAMLGSACIHHAHLHLIPVNGLAVDVVMKRDGLRTRDLSAFGQLSDLAGADLPYFCRSDEQGTTLYGIGQRMQSQYLRAAVAEVLELPPGAYDWSAVVRKDVMRATLRRLSAVFAEHD